MSVRRLSAAVSPETLDPVDDQLVREQRGSDVPSGRRAAGARPLRTGEQPFLRGRPWRLALAKGALAYIASRFIILATGGLMAAADAYRTIVDGLPKPTSAGKFVTLMLTRWDGLWYLQIVRDGYPRHVINPVTYFDDGARAAFFPLFPMLVRALDRIFPGHDTAAALVLNHILGGVFILLVGIIARRVGGDRIATRAMVLTALFPGSFVLSFAYAEALFLCLAAGTLLLLMDRRWLAAGVLAALATATRPNGFALVAACVAAALVAGRHDDGYRIEWRALAAPLLAPVGFIAFQVWLGAHTGEWSVWFRVQRQAWGEGASFGLTALTKTVNFTLHPFHSAVNVVTALCVAATIGCLVALWKARLPLVLTVYSIGIVAMMLMPATVTARPRFLFTAFPLLIAFPIAWPRKDDDWWSMLLALNAAGLMGVTALYGLLAAIP